MQKELKKTSKIEFQISCNIYTIIYYNNILEQQFGSYQQKI